MPKLAMSSVKETALNAKLTLLEFGVIAFAIGGSNRVGHANVYSDIDLFVITDPNKEKSHTARMICRLFQREVIERGPIWVEHFGHSYTFLVENGDIIQININHPSGLLPNPMASLGMNIVFDDEGYFHKLVSDSSINSNIMSQECEKSIEYILLRLNFAIRELRKNRIRSSLTYLLQCREPIYYLICLDSNIYPSSPAVSSKQYHDELTFQFPLKSYNEESIGDNLENCTRFLEEFIMNSNNISSRFRKKVVEALKLTKDL